MEISIRLKKIASLVESCESVADIGTDHGYIPIYLVKNNICKKVIAADINKGPVEKARFNIGVEGCADHIECRLGNGLTTLHRKEVEVAIIAGMGGNLIRDIIENSLDVFKDLKYAVLQPVQNPEVLREYIYKKGFKIIEEELCFDEEKYYEILKIAYDTVPREVEPIFFEISKDLLDKKHPLIAPYINLKLDKCNQVYYTIKEETESARIRKDQIGKKILKLKELLTWIQK